MCEICGYGDPDRVPVEIHDQILAANERAARHNREHFAALGVFAVNLMGSRGAGKTAVLEATARAYGRRRRLAAASGDHAADHDAHRLRTAGIPAVSIAAGSACHLDAARVHRALHDLPMDEADLLFVENVGNLVCPAVYDLGQAANVVVLSVAEGEDQPLRYPGMFRQADLVLLTKTDLLPHLPGVRLESFLDNLAQVMPAPRAFALSAPSGAGLGAWLDWLEEGLAGRAVARRAAAAHHPLYHSQHQEVAIPAEIEEGGDEHL